MTGINENELKIGNYAKMLRVPFSIFCFYRQGEVGVGFYGRNC